MAEALGIAASAISVAQLTWTSCKRLNNIIRGIRDAPETLKSLEGDLTTLVQILESLENKLEPSQSAPFPTSQQHFLDALIWALQGCHNVCIEFTAKISGFTSHSDAVRMSKMDRIRFHFKETDIKLFKENLVQY